MFWGFSESLNLHEEFCKQFPNPPPAELNILLYGSGDPRHILQTLAKSYDHQTQLNFFYIEGCIEIQARNLLLLSIAMEQTEEMSIKCKTHLFMDVYGNSLVRPSSAHYAYAKGETLKKLITDGDYAVRTARVFNFENLKYRERDQLETAFEFWKDRGEYKFEIGKLWDMQLRSGLGARYDHRNGAFDWDLQMKLKDQGAKQICTQEYKQWRETGIAFTFPEYEQAMPNKSFAVQLMRTGSTFSHRGYVGDMSVGPYITFGNGCVDETFLKSNHGVNQFRATDITERNVYEIMHELQEKQKYTHNPKNVHAYGSVYLAQGKTLSGHTSSSDMHLKKYDKPFVPFEKAKIHLLSVEEVLNMQSKCQWQGKFDVVFVASNYFTFLRTEFKNMLKPEAVVLFETKNYSLLKKEDRLEFLGKIKQQAKDFRLKVVTNFNINLPYSVIRYKTEV